MYGRWLRESYSWIFGVLGGFVLFLYGDVPTFQKVHFHRTSAAYGGIFIIMAIGCGCFFEGVVPGTYDIVGTIIASLGVVIIFYYPRKEGEKIAINSSNG